MWMQDDGILYAVLWNDASGFQDGVMTISLYKTFSFGSRNALLCFPVLLDSIPDCQALGI